MTDLRGKTGRFVLIATLLATVGCDHVTKRVVTATLAGLPSRSYLGDTVRIGYLENPGGFLSLGASLPADVRMVVFTLANGIMLLALGMVLIRRRTETWPAWGLSLFLAGGISNWIDRIAHGSVVDFLNVGVGPVRTGVFNVADVAITAGAIVLLVWEMSKGRGADLCRPSL